MVFLCIGSSFSQPGGVLLYCMFFGLDIEVL